MIRVLGTVHRECHKPPALGYSWEVRSGGFLLAVAGPVGAASDGFDVSGWRAFFLAFDPAGVVTRKEFVHLSGRRTLDEQLRKWATR